MKSVSNFSVGLLATLLVQFTPVVVAWGQEDLQNFVPSSAMAALFAKPKDALKQPGMELIPYEIITAFGEKEFGFDPCRITTVVGLIDAVTTVDIPPQFALMVKFDSPQSMSETALERMNLQKGEWNGKAVYSPSHDPEIVLWQQDGQSIIFGNKPLISKMLSARGAKSGLNDQIAQSPPNGHLNVYVNIEPVRGLIKENLPPAGQIPPPFVEFLKLPDLIDAFSMQNSVGVSGQSKFQINAVDNDAALEIEQMLQNGLEMAQQMILAQISNEMSDDDETLRNAIQQYIHRVGDQIRAGFKPAVQDNQLVFEFSNEQSGQMNNAATTGILIGMLLPAVQQTREAARRTVSMNNLRQMVLASHNYADTFGRFPPQATFSPDGKPLLSWRVHILPFIEESALYEQFKLDEPWDSPHNIKLLDQMPGVYRGPNSIHQYKTVYLGISGPGTVFGNKEGTRMADIQDGTSNTIMFVEVNDDAAVEWTKPADYELNKNDPRWGIRGVRPRGFIAAFCDGSVSFINDSVDDETVILLMEMADGKVLPDFR